MINIFKNQIFDDKQTLKFKIILININKQGKNVNNEYLNIRFTAWAFI